MKIEQKQKCTGTRPLGGRRWVRQGGAATAFLEKSYFEKSVFEKSNFEKIHFQKSNFLKIDF
jgi:hypothetical protein